MLYSYLLGFHEKKNWRPYEQPWGVALKEGVGGAANEPRWSASVMILVSLDLLLFLFCIPVPTENHIENQRLRE